MIHWQRRKPLTAVAAASRSWLRQRQRLRGALAAGLLAWAGAGPAPSLAAAPPGDDAPRALPLPALVPQRDDEAAQRQRQVLMTMVRASATRDETVARVTGLKPGTSKFAVIKESLGAIYADDAFLSGLLDSIDAGGEFQRERFTAEWGRRLVSGMNRLDDASALDLLGSIGATLGRLDEAACNRYMTERKKPNAGFDTALLELMEEKDIRRFFGALHGAFRADLERRPMRPMPSSDDVNAVVAMLARIEQDPALKEKASTACGAAQVSIEMIERADPALRPAAITTMLSMAGFFAQKASAAR